MTVGGDKRTGPVPSETNASRTTRTTSPVMMPGPVDEA